MTISQVLATGKTKIKDHKGGRLWIEGGKLLRAGFEPGHEYYAFIYDGCIIIANYDRGEPLQSQLKTVSGKGNRPIIDLCSAAIGEAFGLGSAVSVTYQEGLITVQILEG